jgi:ComF family protein
MLQTFYRSFILPVQDIIYPPICLTCNDLISDRSSKLCLTCRKSLTSIDHLHPTWSEIKSKFDDEGYVSDMISCFLFEKEGKFQEVIHLLKYRGIKSIGVELGRTIGVKMQAISLYSSADVLVPIPLHKLKKRERGYNQSEFLCHGISEITHIPVNAKLLLRIKYTESQTQLNLQERKENVDDAFTINKKFLTEVERKTFILVDDVITTGSTINACARVLLDHGAEKVFAVSAALAK